MESGGAKAVIIKESLRYGRHKSTYNFCWKEVYLTVELSHPRTQDTDTKVMNNI